MLIDVVAQMSQIEQPGMGPIQLFDTAMNMFTSFNCAFLMSICQTTACQRLVFYENP